jgi:hypothetical protein
MWWHCCYCADMWGYCCYCADMWWHCSTFFTFVKIMLSWTPQET